MSARGPADERMRCEFCGTALVNPLEEPFNLHFIQHLKQNPRCMELFGYGVANLRNELAARRGGKPVVEGL